MIELPTEAIGFHGTNRDAVAHLLAEEIQQSDQHFEWLGSGRGARFRLDGCADLLNPYWQRELADADDQYVAECLADGRAPAQNRPSGNRARDCAVINWRWFAPRKLR